MQIIYHLGGIAEAQALRNRPIVATCRNRARFAVIALETMTQKSGWDFKNLFLYSSFNSEERQRYEVNRSS
jgi:hypothetical protein